MPLRGTSSPSVFGGLNTLTWIKVQTGPSGPMGTDRQLRPSLNSADADRMAVEGQAARATCCAAPVVAALHLYCSQFDPDQSGLFRRANDEFRIGPTSGTGSSRH